MCYNVMRDFIKLVGDLNRYVEVVKFVYVVDHSIPSKSIICCFCSRLGEDSLMGFPNTLNTNLETIFCNVIYLLILSMFFVYY